MSQSPRGRAARAAAEQAAAAALVWFVVAAGSDRAHLRLDPAQLDRLESAWLAASLLGLAVLALFVVLRVRRRGAERPLALPLEIGMASLAVSFGTFAVPAAAGALTGGFPLSEAVKAFAVGAAVALAASALGYHLAARRFFRRPEAPLPEAEDRPPFPLAKKTAALSLALVTACLCLLGTAAFTSMQQESERVARDLLRARVARILARLRSGPAPAAEGWRHVLAGEAPLFPFVRVEVWDRVGHPIAWAGPDATLRPELAARRSGADLYELVSSGEAEIVRHVGRPVAMYSRVLSDHPVRIVASVRVADADDYTARAVRWIGIPGLTLVTLAAFLSLLSAVAVSRPLDALTRQLDRFAEGITPAGSPTGDDELAGFSVAFEEMARRIGVQTRVIHQAKVEWERTFDAIPAILYLIDPDGKIVRANRAITVFLGRRFPEVIGRSAASFGLPVELRDTPVVIPLHASPGRVFRYLGYPYSSPQARAVSIHVLEDVTEAETMRQRAVSAERQAAMGELVGRVAHEVRNPLFGIAAATRVLKDAAEDGADVKPAIDHVERETKRLITLMEGLLEYRRPVTRARVRRAVETMLREASASAQLRHKERPARFELELAGDLPEVEVDEVRFAQVIGNLLDNAVASAPEVTVRLLARRDGGDVVVEVADSGPGLSEEARRRAFEPFFSGRPGGSGLGLRIAKHTMEEHGGSIAIATSDLGGALVTLRLPAVAAETPAR